jgi:uncharacterized heparinase superfamily protein
MLRALGKLRGRSFAELRERAGQAIALRAERWDLRDYEEPSDANLRQWLGGRDLEGWRAHFAARTEPRLFASFDAPHATAQAIREIDPDYATRVIRRADAALGGYFDLLGYRGLAFGSTIDWHLDPVTRVRAPGTHWSKIDYLNPRVAGDHKVVWELNRQQWLVDLGAAWWLTGDDHYGRGMIAALTQWMNANRPKRGVNWSSSLEVAFRAISWIWALEFLRRSALLGSETLARLTKYLVLHGRHLERYLSTYFSPNTHLTGEALGLFYLGTYFPELTQAAAWRERGAGILLDQLSRHVLRDGVYFEQTVHYQRYTIDFYTHLWLLDEANGGTLSVEISPQLDALLEHVQCLTRGDGTVPLLGDEDGGRLFFLDARPLNDLRGSLAVGAVLCGRPDFAFVAGAPSADIVWLLGADAHDRFAAIGKLAPRYLSRAFEEGGVYIMRDGWERDSNHLVIDCGRHGTMNCGHAHADALAFELALRGHAVFVDPGTYTYTADAAQRDAFRSSVAHNAATVDGVGSSEPDGPFHWRRIAAANALAWRTQNGGRAAYFEGSHSGFEQLPSPVHYRRAVDFDTSREQMIVLRDHFDCNASHTATLSFQCAPGIQVARLAANRVELRGDGRPICQVETLGEGEFEIEDAWVSRVYGARERATRCRFVARLNPGTTTLTSTVSFASVSRSTSVVEQLAPMETR